MFIAAGVGQHVFHGIRFSQLFGTLPIVTCCAHVTGCMPPPSQDTFPVVLQLFWKEVRFAIGVMPLPNIVRRTSATTRRMIATTTISNDVFIMNIWG